MPDTNVALSKFAGASSFQTGNQPSHANDGSMTTRWAAVDATFPQWWSVDLGASYVLSRIDIYWYTATSRYYQYKVDVSADSGTVQRDFYYSTQWQVLEERVGGSSSADIQYLWGTRYRDDLVLRYQGSTSLFALSDYFQITSICDNAGNIQERYVYTAFGSVSYYDPSFNPTGGTNYGWRYLYGSYQFDPETLFYQVRNRYYHSGLGRWLSRDPLQDAEQSQGANLYWYVGNNCINTIDALGLDDGFQFFMDEPGVISKGIQAEAEMEAQIEAQEAQAESQGTFDVVFDDSDPKKTEYNQPVKITYHKDKSCTCQKIKIAQVYKTIDGHYQIDDHFQGQPAPDSPFYPQQDVDKTGNPQIYDRPGYDKDKSGSIVAPPGAITLAWTQSFETCAVCADKIPNKILGCTTWSHGRYYGLFGGLGGTHHESDGGGMGKQALAPTQIFKSQSGLQ